MKQFISKNNLVDILFNVNEVQMKQALSSLSFLPEIGTNEEELGACIPESLRDHIKAAMFITMKSIQMKGHSFKDIFITEPEGLLRNLANLLNI